MNQNSAATGVELIADADHEIEQLAYAAACYATPAPDRRMIIEPNNEFQDPIPDLWPWLPRHWKPTPDDRVRELVKAGALIAAEIDRLAASGVSV